MKLYQVDSFTTQLFRGNPAAVCLIEGNWPNEQLMQNIASENNLSETAFLLNTNGEYSIRWFTPTTEVPLCGHATLAAAHVLYNHEGFKGKQLILSSTHHMLSVTYEGDMLTLDLPADNIHQIPFEAHLDCFNFKPAEVWRGTEEYLLVFKNQKEIENAVCDLKMASTIDLAGFIITAKSNLQNTDFVSRYFGPKIGIDEDPVTGSAHTILVPYWSKVTGKTQFNAAQLSKRGGQLRCRLEGDRVKIGGKAVTYLIGEIVL